MRVARLAAAVALLGVLAVPRASAELDPPPGLPGPDVSAALDRLAQPSHPVALAGDTKPAADRWLHHGSCTDVDAAYQSAEAPIPAGATVTPGLRLSLTVDGPFGPSGIFVSDQPALGRCVYNIAADPTVSVTAQGLAVTDQFLPVGCASIFGAPLILAEVDNGGVVTSVAVSHQAPDPWRAAIVAGTLEQALQQSGSAPGAIDATGEASYDGTTLAFDGTSAAGPVSIHLTCTAFTTLATAG